MLSGHDNFGAVRRRIGDIGSYSDKDLVSGLIFVDSWRAECQLIIDWVR
jgi:hypothetical protein